MKQKPTIISLFLLFLSASLFSQEATIVGNSKALFNQYEEHITPYRALSFETVLEKTAQFFIGTPYVAHTLDMGSKEELVVNLESVDCVTFVENILALSLSAHSSNFSFEDFVAQLQKIRYRNGEVVDYSSRLHYTSDWIYENEQNNLLKNISQQLSGKLEDKPINFMSSHRSAYKQLATDNAMWQKIKEMEKRINKRGGFYYLPKGAIYSKSKEIPHMALIGFVTQIKGLDTTHVGFAYQSDDGLSFIHASSTAGKVVIDSSTLSNYCFSQKNCIGVVIAKVLSKRM